MAQIGIKLADHTFYPVIDDETPQRKRVVLTAAREDQSSIQIDLILREDSEDRSIGTLLLEDLETDASREFEFIVGVDGQRNVDASITDATGRQTQSLSANLEDTGVSQRFSLPDEDGISDDIGGVAPFTDDLPDTDESFDFDLSDDLEDEGSIHDAIARNADAPADDGAGIFDEFSIDDDLGDVIDDEEEGDPAPTPRAFNPLLLVALLLISLSILALAAFGVFSWLKADSVPELRTTLSVIGAFDIGIS